MFWIIFVYCFFLVFSSGIKSNVALEWEKEIYLRFKLYTYSKYTSFSSYLLEIVQIIAKRVISWRADTVKIIYYAFIMSKQSLSFIYIMSRSIDIYIHCMAWYVLILRQRSDWMKTFLMEFRESGINAQFNHDMSDIRHCTDMNDMYGGKFFSSFLI